jgi:hypothetical protein
VQTSTIRFSVFISGTQTLCMTVSHVPLQGAATGAQPVLQGAEQQWLVFLPKQPPASAEAASEQARTNDRTRRMRKHSYRTEEQLLRGATPGCGNHSPQFAPSCFLSRTRLTGKRLQSALTKVRSQVLFAGGRVYRIW